MAKKPKDIPVSWLQPALLRTTGVHFWLVFAYGLIIVLSDAWNLITSELVWQRWAMACTMLIITSVIWYLSRANIKSTAYYRTLIIVLIVMDIVLATFTVYTERGMASRGVMLYALPIAVSAVLLNRSALYSTAALCTAAYIMAATRYFYAYFNEGLKIELYTTLGMYCAAFFILAAFIWTAIRTRFD